MPGLAASPAHAVRGSSSGNVRRSKSGTVFRWCQGAILNPNLKIGFATVNREKCPKLKGQPTLPLATPGRLAVELAHALRGRDDVGQAYTELVIHDNDLALCDERAIDQNIHRLASHGVEFDD